MNSLNLIQKRPYLWDSDKKFQPTKRVAKLLGDIQDLLEQAHNYYDFAPKTSPAKGSSKDGCHRLRLLHDELLLDYKSNRCIGTIYRSEAVLNCPTLAVGAEAEYLATHGEHVIPINLISRMIWQRNQTQKFEHETLLKFIAERACVCQITKQEEEKLRERRNIADKHSSWTWKHPCIRTNTKEHLVYQDLDGNQIDENQTPVFARYLQSGLKIFAISDGTAQPLNFEKFTLAEHIKIAQTHYKIPQ